MVIVAIVWPVTIVARFLFSTIMFHLRGDHFHEVVNVAVHCTNSRAGRPIIRTRCEFANGGVEDRIFRVALRWLRDGRTVLTFRKATAKRIFLKVDRNDALWQAVRRLRKRVGDDHAQRTIPVPALLCGTTSSAKGKISFSRSLRQAVALVAPMAVVFYVSFDPPGVDDVSF